MNPERAAPQAAADDDKATTPPPSPPQSSPIGSTAAATNRSRRRKRTTGKVELHQHQLEEGQRRFPVGTKRTSSDADASSRAAAAAAAPAVPPPIGAITPEGKKQLAVLEDDLDRLVKSLLVTGDDNGGDMSPSSSLVGSSGVTSPSGSSATTSSSASGGGSSSGGITPVVTAMSGRSIGTGEMAAVQQQTDESDQRQKKKKENEIDERQHRRLSSDCSNKTDGTGQSDVWDGINDNCDESDSGEGTGSGTGTGTGTGTGSSASKKNKLDLCRKLQLNLGGDELMDAVEELLSVPSPPPSPPPQDQSPTFGEPTINSNLLSPTRTLSGKKIHTLPLKELHTEKKRLKRRLQRYDADFYTRFGRKAEKDDKEPIRALYETYNVLKERITQAELEELMGNDGETNAISGGDGKGRGRRQMQLSDLVRIVEEDEDGVSSCSSDNDGAGDDDGVKGGGNIFIDKQDDKNQQLVVVNDDLVTQEHEISTSTDPREDILNVTPPPLRSITPSPNFGIESMVPTTSCNNNDDDHDNSNDRVLLPSPIVPAESDMKSPGQARVIDELYQAEPPLLRKGFVKMQVHKLTYRSSQSDAQAKDAKAAVVLEGAVKDEWEPNFDPKFEELFSSNFFSSQKEESESMVVPPSPIKAARPTTSTDGSSVDSPIKPRNLFAAPTSPSFTADGTADTADITASSSMSNDGTGTSVLSTPVKQEEPVPIAVVLMDVDQDKFELLGLKVEWQKNHVKNLLDAVTGAIEAHTITKDEEKEVSSPVKTKKFKTVSPSPLSCGSASTNDDTPDDDYSYSSESYDPPSEINIEVDADHDTGAKEDLSTTVSSTHVPFAVSANGPGSIMGKNNKWSVQYDGLIQGRHTDKSDFEGMLLINCFGLKRYDVTPQEILVAKPKGMSVKEASEHAGRLVNRLVRTGMLQCEDTATTLSLSALERAATSTIDGTDNLAVEACLLAFSPPFDISAEKGATDETGSSTLLTTFNSVHDEEGDESLNVSGFLDLFPSGIDEDVDVGTGGRSPDPLLKKIFRPDKQLGSFCAAVTPIHEEDAQGLLGEKYAKPHPSTSSCKFSLKNLGSIANKKMNNMSKGKQVYDAIGRSSMNDVGKKGVLKKKPYSKFDDISSTVCLDRTASDDEKTYTTYSEDNGEVKSARQ